MAIQLAEDKETISRIKYVQQKIKKETLLLIGGITIVIAIVRKRSKSEAADVLNEEDKKRARKLGVAPGGDIMIHGIKNGLSWVGNLHAQIDWTQGCIAVTNKEMEQIARLVPNGTAVEIRP